MADRYVQEDVCVLKNKVQNHVQDTEMPLYTSRKKSLCEKEQRHRCPIFAA